MKIAPYSPQDIRQRIWKELGRATQDRHHAWRTPVLATVANDGTANARTVVLRGADATRQTLHIYTDARSPKVDEFARDPHAAFVFWSARLSWQLRVRVRVTVATDGPEVQDLWQCVQGSAAAGDYLAPEAPGSPRFDGLDASQADARGPEVPGHETPSHEVPGDAQGHAAHAAHEVHHFALLTAQVLEMDWLELSRDGHRRACLREDQWEWLTP